jgi:hypothetical protein
MLRDIPTRRHRRHPLSRCGGPDVTPLLALDGMLIFVTLDGSSSRPVTYLAYICR